MAQGVVFDREAAPMRVGAVQRGDTKEYLSLSKQRNAGVRRRRTALGLVALVVLMLALVAHW